jgi:hypothetical protein
MNAFSQDLRTKSIFQLLGIAGSENQEDDLKLAELGTLRQFVLNLQSEGAPATQTDPVSEKITALESATAEAYTTQLDALYAQLNEQFPQDLTTRLEKAVEDFKVDVLSERIAFLKEAMNARMEGLFAKANDLLKAQDLNTLLPYLDEIQEYLKSVSDKSDAKTE